ADRARRAGAPRGRAARDPGAGRAPPRSRRHARLQYVHADAGGERGGGRRAAGRGADTSARRARGAARLAARRASRRRAARRRTRRAAHLAPSARHGRLLRRAAGARVTRPIVIAPSILSADFGRLAEQVQAVEAAGADWIHVDVMDGRFVPNITIGPVVVKAVREAASRPLDVHLMIVEPERYVEAFVAAGAARLGVQVEACTHVHRTIGQIREAGAKACVVLNPG